MHRIREFQFACNAIRRFSSAPTQTESGEFWARRHRTKGGEDKKAEMEGETEKGEGRVKGFLANAEDGGRKRRSWRDDSDGNKKGRKILKTNAEANECRPQALRRRGCRHWVR